MEELQTGEHSVEQDCKREDVRCRPPLLALAEEDAHRNLLWPQPSADHTWPLAGDLAHAIRRVADAVVAHTAGSDARTRRINASYESFRRVALGDGVSAPGQETV